MEFVYLQIDPGVGEVGRRVFEINPETVYGVLALLLFAYGAYMTWQNNKLNAEVKDLLKENVSALKDINNGLGTLRREIEHLEK